MDTSRFRHPFTLLSVLLISLFGHSLALAAPVEGVHSRIELVAESEAIVPGETFNLAVHFEIDPHWHIYWLNPGASGLPPEITWELPEGFVPGEIEWPSPERIELGGLVNYGYEDVATLVVPVQAPASLEVGTTVEIGAELFYLICEKECLPGDAGLKLSMPVTAEAGSGEDAPLFEKARMAQPEAEVPWNLVAAVTEEGVVIELSATGGAAIPMDLYFYAEAEGLIDPDAAQTLSFVGESTARLSLEKSVSFDDVSEYMSAFRGLLQSADATWAVEIPLGALSDAAVSAEAEVVDEPAAEVGFEGKLLSLGLPGWLALAFLGGLILNIMPCVLPVLSLKVFSLLKHTGQSRKESILHGGAYTVGVIASFLILAGVLFSLRAVGEQIGWGFQLQSPGFIVLLSAVFFLFGLNLMGVFEIGSSLVGADSGVAQRSDLLGSLGMGVLAAVVGAPCMGPMVASVSGIAIQADVWTGLLIFATMGAGLASPFMLLAIFPTLVAYLPKPGLWMESVKQFMGFLLMAAVVFLLWVAGGLGGTEAILAIAVLLLILALASWIYGRWAAPVRSKRSKWIARMLALVLIAGGGAYGLKQAEAAFEAYTSGSDVEDGDQWSAWSREKVDAALAEGTPVFVDFTATWCLICQVNKKVALRTDETEALFEEYGVMALEADWTRRDDAITTELEAFGRAGVPLYVLYLPDGGTSVLPQSLTNGIVREALEKALN